MTFSALVVHSANTDAKRVADALSDGLQKNGGQVTLQEAAAFKEAGADLHFLVSTHDFFSLDKAIFNIAESGALRGKRTAAVVVDAGLGKRALEKLERVLAEHGADLLQSLLLHKTGALRGIGGAIPSNELMHAEAFARRVAEPFTTRTRKEKEKERIRGYKK